MSSIVEHYARVAAQEELARHLNILLEADVIEGDAARGITRLVVNKGRAALSDKQAYVFRTYVEAPFCEPECEICGCSILINEAWDLEQGYLATECSSCQFDLAKREE